MDVALKRIADAVRRTCGGVVSSAIEARAVPGMGVGVVAREHIPKDTLVFQAGRDAWYPFSADCALDTAQQRAPGFVQQWEALLASNRTLRNGPSVVPHALVMAVHLLVNFTYAERDSDAALVATTVDTLPLEELYVNALPRVVDLPLLWRQRQLEELQGCEEARRAMQHGVHFYSQIHRHLFGSHNQFVKMEAFFWAISILMSRATSGQDQPFTLIPFFDWFNHANNGGECIQAFDPQKGFTVHTTKAYERGEQLFISYGNHGNLRLLRNYGFTIAANPFDVVDLPMPDSVQQLNPADPAFAQKRESLLSSAAGTQTDGFALKRVRFQHDGSLDPSAKLWLAILLATPEELNEIVRHAVVQRTPGDAMAPLLLLPPTLTRKVDAVVHKLVTRRLEQHSSSLKEDETFLRANDQRMAAWLRSCLHVRMSEKQTLMRAASKHA